MSKPGWKTITIDILANISRGICNQTIKFGQLIKYNRNVFLENHMLNMVEKLVPDPFLKKSKLSISQDHSEVLYSLFLLYVQVECYRIYWN